MTCLGGSGVLFILSAMYVKSLQVKIKFHPQFKIMSVNEVLLLLGQTAATPSPLGNVVQKDKHFPALSH